MARAVPDGVECPVKQAGYQYKYRPALPGEGHVNLNGARFLPKPLDIKKEILMWRASARETGARRPRWRVPEASDFTPLAKQGAGAQLFRSPLPMPPESPKAATVAPEGTQPTTRVLPGAA